jgi:hypothetical protein
MAPAPVAAGVFGGACDPSSLGFKVKMLTALSASPTRGQPEKEHPRQDAIRDRGRGLGCQGPPDRRVC